MGNLCSYECKDLYVRLLRPDSSVLGVEEQVRKLFSSLGLDDKVRWVSPGDLEAQMVCLISLVIYQYYARAQGERHS